METLTRIDVVVGFDGETAGKSFPPNTLLREVERWAADALETPTKAPYRLALRHADTVLEPDEDATLASLDANEDGDLRFDLRVERLVYDLVVNGQPREFYKRRISFDEVVELAGGPGTTATTIYDVTYANGPRANPEGTMVQGDVVKVQDNMRFNATATNKS